MPKANLKFAFALVATVISTPAMAATVYNVTITDPIPSQPIGKITLAPGEYSFQFTSTGPAWFTIYRFFNRYYCRDSQDYFCPVSGGGYEMPFAKYEAGPGNNVFVEYFDAPRRQDWFYTNSREYEVYQWSFAINTYDPSTGRQTPVGTEIELIVQPVPEPSTWAMMIGGFGLIGGAYRLRRRQARYA